jgi:hypothetical protein
MILPWRNIVPILKEYGANYVSFAGHKNVRCISHGFGSIRSFNRVFREIFKMTPKEYIKQKKLFSL